MLPAHKKLLIGLSAITIVFLFILVKQVRTARYIITKTEQMPLISQVSIPIPLSPTDYMLGNPGAPLTVVGFIDFSDERSRTYYSQVTKVVREQPTKVRFIVKHYPGYAFFSDPLLPHKAAECAGAQGKFWEYANLITQDKRTPNEKRLHEFAEQNMLAVKTWEDCLEAEQTEASIIEDVAVGQSLYLPEAPIFFINNKLLNPAEDIDLSQLLTSFITE